MAYDIKFLRGTSTAFKQESFVPDNKTFYYLTDTDQLYIGAFELTNSGTDAAIQALKTQIGEDEDATKSLESQVKALEALTARLDGDATVTNSVKAQIKDLKESIDVAVAASAITDESGDVNVLTGFEIEDGELKANSVTEQRLKKVAVSGAAVDISIADAADNFTATTVEAALAELASDIADSTSAGEVTISEAAGTGNVAKVYSFYQGGNEAENKIGEINIPKDQFLKSAEYKTATKELELVFVVADGSESTVDIDVSDLVDTYTGGETTEISIAVADNEFTATVKKVAATKIIYKEAVPESSEGAGDGQAEVTVKKALDDLATAIADAQSDAEDYTDTKIGDLDATVSIEDTENTNPLNITITEENGLLTGVSGSIDAETFDAYGAASAVQGETTTTVEELEDYVGAIPETATATTVIGYIDEKTGEGVSALNVTEFPLTEDNNDIISIYGIKEAAGKIAKGDTKIDLAKVAKTGDAEDVAYGTSDVKAELDKIEGDASTAGSIAKAQADAVATAVGTGTGRSGEGTAEDPYVYEDTIKGAKTYAADLVNGNNADLIGDPSDDKTADTINGAKNFATDAADTAEANANSYTDDALTWGTF